MTLASQVGKITSQERTDRAAAAAVDRLLDACHIDRYYFLEDRAYSPYARHSPLNFYIYTRIEHIDRYHPIYYAESFRRLAEARVILLSRPYRPLPRPGNAEEAHIGEVVRMFVQSRFTSATPACAAGLPPIPGYFALWRRDMADTSGPNL